MNVMNVGLRFISVVYLSVRRGNDQQSTGPQNPPKFFDDFLRFGYVFDCLHRDNDVETAVGEWNVVGISNNIFEMRGPAVKPIGLSDHRCVDVDADDPLGNGAQNRRSVALTASDIENYGVGDVVFRKCVSMKMFISNFSRITWLVSLDIRHLLACPLVRINLNAL